MDQQQSQQDNTIQEALHTYKEGLQSFTQKLPHIAKSYNKFTETCFEEGTLTKKGKQLIALGISVYSQDEYCIIYHTKGCLDQGCSEDEILESVGVAAAFGGGAAMSQGVTLVQEAIQKLKSPGSDKAFQ
ncbi:carboxymuconolactone decarboxylase family protein [Alkalicoccobacillus plakortidis]|uniref:Carboxymuconolactone decarboxylase family protein n=1 Tax=Alkalicoccobacillus plakortidis TaxID=444060 RepID=A0ABT0XI06_9BACI|nr:carboxymuconolactone decarboxylase family protein [Alkalicoccobacillus plakortidis]MCM2675519.1 carboxymuconolactone decarboxylase family protein [Alkalicoccobacillus plakortidis]